MLFPGQGLSQNVTPSRENIERIEQLIYQLKDKDPAKKLQAAKSIMAIFEKSSLEYLKNAVREIISRNNDMRHILVQVLKDENEDVKFPAGICILLDPEPERARLYMTVYALQEGDGEILENVRDILKDSFLSTWPLDAYVFIRALKDEDPYTRMAAVWILSQLDTKTDLIPHFFQALKDENLDVRTHAATALGKEEVRDEEVVSLIIKVLDVNNRLLLKDAAKALGEIGSPEAVPYLIKTLKDEDPDVRKQAAEALGEIGSPKAVPHLIKALEDEDQDVREVAAEALGKAPRKRSLISVSP